MRTIDGRWATLGSLVLVAVAGLAGGCGDDAAATLDAASIDAPEIDARLPTPIDAAPDADLRDAESPPVDDAGMLMFGPGLILDQVALRDSGHSWAPYAPLANAEFEIALADGLVILLVELRDLDDPTGQDDADGVDLAIYSGFDSDYWPDDNFSGSEPLQVEAESLDPVGNPRSLVPAASLAGGALLASTPGPVPFFFPGMGEIPVYELLLDASLTAAPVGESVIGLGGTLQGVLLARDLGRLPNPIVDMCAGDTMLDVIAIGCLSVEGIQPDVDVDGDGLERFEVVDYTDWVIDRCIDGDGTAYVSIPGIPCVLDEAFADGYTVHLDVHGVRAILLPPELP